jgi:pyridoxal/pyridoxine/pyridoxamine kinase|tara:strand:+ start:417 stop:524 length:108 start_codon:yes stop_codon:yes gene_type:complete
LFRTKIIPKAYMITPNQFEAEKLSEIEIKDFDTVL